VVDLVVLNGPCAGARFAIPDVPVAVGRSLEANVRIDDPCVSNIHALIERRGGELWVVDLESRNGTFVDDRLITEARLAPGMSLAFGQTRLELQVRDAASPIDTKAMKTPFRRPHLSVTAPQVASPRPGGPPVEDDED
jgi:pSer/pThr/pTyr-binding forkhead associated (FHA) protein